MIELSRDVLETLREDGEFVLSRGRREGDRSPLLVVAPALAQPAPESLQRLAHAYALREALEPTWAACPLALGHHQGRLTLLLEDPGGEVLERLLGHPLELTQCLRMAIGLAVALGRLHARGLIHKDIKPANILVHVGTGRVWLTGFGMASRLPRERQAPAPPEVIAGTFAYMAPEQTGRMNRSIDARSDLYALGVTLYEMLTGTLPFTASDPLEWIHCHIARQPVPPSERVSGLPGPVTAIVLKLLAKTAEDRYQTAAGVEADLRCCLTAWEAYGRIDPFPLGAHDASDRLLIPEKLYGREAEIDALGDAFDRVVTHGTTELVLVSGYAGIGKSSTVNELHQVLVPPRGLFAAGKFDQYKRDIPYPTLAQAFQSLVRQLLSKNDTELGQWRHELLEALGPNGQLVVNLIPELALIIGGQPPVPDVPPQDAQNRFQLVFRRFLGVFARPEHPLALFLDDLQWLDTATLELLERLVTEAEVRHLLLVGAYRDNEVGPSHPLMRTLEVIRNSGGRVQEIVLAPLKLEDVERLVADALHAEREHVRLLAELVCEKTGGNPFFAIQFVAALVDEGLLVFDPDASAWQWDMDRIRAQRITDNVAHLMAGKLHRLPGATREALQQLACMGNRAQTATLSMVLGVSEEEVHAVLWEGVRAGLIVRLDGVYTFLHDRVQEAAYALIPDGDRAQVHLQIGRLLASRTAPEELEETIFEVVHQFNCSAALLTSREERTQVAAFNLLAGKRAKAATAYAAALAYFAAGRAMLAEDSWERQYRLTFDLECHHAECEFLTGELAAAAARLLALLRHAANLVDRAAVTRLRVVLYTTLARFDLAIEVGLEYLRHVGINWPPHPTEGDVRQECERMWQLLNRRPIDQLLDLPLMTSPEWRATMDVCMDLVPSAVATDSNLVDLILVRMVNLSLEHGNCDASCYAYTCLSRVLGIRFGDYQTALRFGQLACDLVERRGLDRFKARVYTSFGGVVIPWTKHLPTSRPLMRRAIDASNASGDMTFVVYGSQMLTTHLLISGEPLGDVQREAENGFAFARKVGFSLLAERFVGQLMLIRTLRGLQQDVVSQDDPGQGDDWFEAHLDEKSDLAHVVCRYWIYKLQARFFMQDYAAGIIAAASAERLLWSLRALVEAAEYHFYGALTQAAVCDSASGAARRQHLEALVAHHRQIAVWAENCPENFANRAALVGAEIARLEGRELEAMRLYEEAIRLAREHSFIQNEGLANELAARFYAARGFETIADAYLRNARSCYLRWGADGKVRQLDEAHPHLRQSPASLPSDSTIGMPVAHLDLATVVKVSQTVSGEIVLERLIDTLMVLALEHAGAARGLLLLPRGGGLRLAAEATTGRDRIKVRLRQAEVASGELPASILRYVLRTQGAVLLDDAAAPNQFSADTYLRQTHARSVLCLPLLKQSRLIGVLYLENNLADRVFTPARVAVLQLLASQAAISLENACLYADVQQAEAYLAAAQRLSHTGSFGWRPATGDIVWSEETYRIAGYDRAMRPSLALVLQRVHPDDVAFVQETIARASRDGTDLDFEHRFLMPDGSVQYLHVVAQAVKEAQGALEYVGAVMDVTAPKLSQQALEGAFRDMQALKDQHRLVIDSIPGLVWSARPDGSADLFNQRWLEYAGLSLEEALGWGWEAAVHPDDLARLTDGWRAVLAAGKPSEIEARLRRFDGEYRRFLIRVVPVYDELGNLVKWYGTNTDIEDRKRAEDALHQAQAALAHVTRVTMLGELTASIAHEVNQPLAGVITNAQACLRWLGREVADVEEARAAVERIIRDGQRASEVIRRIRALATKTDPHRERLDLNEVIHEVVRLIDREVLGRRVSLHTDLAAARLPVVGDRVQLQQVLMNLVINGIDAMASMTDRPRRLVIRSHQPAADQVCVAVQDSGVGIDPANVDRLFHAFFTTKPNGMGMGLSISRSIIEAHGGRLWASRNVGPGATFQFTLPRHGERES
jgi:PAS domain S-box-containing protein